VTTTVETWTGHDVRKVERDMRKALEGVAVGLSLNLERLEQARNDYESIDEAIENLRYSIREAEELRELVLIEHRDSHHEVSPRFCSSEVCRKAAGEQ
jgi:hypothetical protein